MVGLLDIAELTETVTIRGVKLKVAGLSAADLVHLIAKFPEIRKAFADRGEDIAVQDWIALAPKAVAAAIAAGLGSAGDEQAERAAASLSAGEQAELLAVIFRLTFPKGLGPFVDSLTSLAEGVNVGADAFGKDQATRSPVRSKSSLPKEGTHQA